ncbi:uncharacterized protein LOC107655821 [Sinocyclocheilus anshuiensis]|uniref:uncharacterized protein LOC107655821 n=1 Tax=Sinocyclocheilus anshuiensis TaxID=1608454 RepID=UPI0007BA22A1|nr:PREDICTED: uncharacterized protein LOC107655821 [Sinocyclocheilus anshuiensis]
MCDGDDEDVDSVEVDFVEVTAVLEEDDGLQFQLPKHHRCACHLLNLVSTVDAAKACSNEAYKKLSRLSPVEIAFLEEYARTMSPLAKALNILQAEIDVQMGWLLPTLTLLISKLDRIRITSRYCKLLVDAIQEGLQQRFGNMLVEPEFIAAAILVPKFKTSWTTDEHIVKLGLDYIKDHLEEETSNQTPVDGSSASEEEDFFASMKSTHGQEGIKQLDGYLACKADNKEILKSFPAVCKLSLKVNTALPASAACERLFSTAGLIFSPRRARMNSKNFENQLLLKLNKKYCHFS